MTNHTVDTMDTTITVITPPPRPASTPATVPDQGHQIRRIASALFCSAGIHPSVISFAKHRTAAHGGQGEDEIDIMIADQILHIARTLFADPRRSQPEPRRSHPATNGPRGRADSSTAAA